MKIVLLTHFTCNYASFEFVDFVSPSLKRTVVPSWFWQLRSLRTHCCYQVRIERVSQLWKGKFPHAWNITCITLICAVLYFYGQVSLKCAPKGYDIEKNTISENDELGHDILYNADKWRGGGNYENRSNEIKRQILSDWLYLFPE